MRSRIRLVCPSGLPPLERDHPKCRMMQKHKPLPSAALLHELLEYDQITGGLHWKVRAARNVFAGSPAGCLTKTGYLCIRINRVTYRANRIIWRWMTGEDPGPDVIDHIDGDRLNNAFDNLRRASYAENNRNRTVNRNNTSGYKGVCWHKNEKKWYVAIRHNGVKKHIGCFSQLEAAHAAYRKASAEFHGKFARAA